MNKQKREEIEQEVANTIGAIHKAVPNASEIEVEIQTGRE